MTPKTPDPAKESPSPAAPATTDATAPPTADAAKAGSADTAKAGSAADTAAAVTPAAAPNSTADAPATGAATAASPTSSTPAVTPPAVTPPVGITHAKSATPAHPSAARPRARGAGAATALAFLSLMVAVGGVGIGLYALDVAREAKSAAAPTISRYPAPVATAPSAVASASTPAAIIPPTPRPVFLAEIVTAQVTVPAADGCAPVYVDVDALAVGTSAGHEFYLSSCLGPLTLRIDRKDSAAPIVTNATAEACAAQLAGTQSAPELALQVRQGLAFCLLTSREDAADQGIPQRLAIVKVNSVAVDRSVVLEVSTFRVQPPREATPGA